MAKLNHLLFFAGAMGMVLPQAGILGKDLSLLFLGASLFFSLAGSRMEFRLNRSGLTTGLLYNYLFLTLILLAFAFFLPDGIREGMMLYAIVPPAIGMIVLSKSWGGNYRDVFMFHMVSYGASIVFIPLASLLLFGQALDAFLLLKYLVLVFGIPMMLSFFIKFKDEKASTLISNVLLAFVFYISISVAQQAILDNLAELAFISLALFLITIIPPIAIFKLTRNMDGALYSFMKNGTVAVGLSVVLLEPSSTLILSIKVLFNIITIVVLGRMVGK